MSVSSIVLGRSMQADILLQSRISHNIAPIHDMKIFHYQHIDFFPAKSSPPAAYSAKTQKTFHFVFIENVHLKL